jgi:hypothetical protein
MKTPGLAEPAHAPQRLAHFAAPHRLFVAVIGPVAAMMLLLTLAGGMPPWIRISAGIVVACSGYAYWRGYLHWVEVSPDGVAACAPGRRRRIPWTQVRRIGRYTPPDRNRTAQYVYISTVDAEPAGRSDPQTIQLQDRPGLLDLLLAVQREHTGAETGDDRACQPPAGVVD